MQSASQGRRFSGAAALFFFTAKTRAKVIIFCKAITLSACVLLFFSCNTRALPPQSEFVLGTVCSINLYESGTEELYAKLFARLRALNDIFNNYSDFSEISRVNKSAADKAAEVSQDFYNVLKRALEFARLTDGAFDPTVGPLMKLWGFGKDTRVPSAEEIEAAKKTVGWQNVILTSQDAAGHESDAGQDAGGEQKHQAGQKAAAPSVRFKKNGTSLDLGAIAKGYAADELVRILRERKVKRAAVSLGGNVYVYGKKRGHSLWNVAIRDPFDPGKNAFMLKTKDATVVTSGGYERFFEQDGKRYCHILDPSTGRPAESGFVSVTIVSADSMTADALSTSLFVLGMEKISEIKKSHIAGGFDFVCVAADGTAYASQALKENLAALGGQKIVFVDW